VILQTSTVDPAAFSERTGWELKPEGACKGDVCVPLDAARLSDGSLDAAELGRLFGMPLVADTGRGVWALGPETAFTGRALTTAIAPDLELPDRDGNPFRLSSLLGKKVLLVAWASW
jgi:hypothetical protein